MEQPKVQQISLSPQQVMGLLINDLMQSQIKLKEMMVVKSTPEYEEAVSTFHEDTQRKYGLRILKDEEQIIFDLWVPIPNSNELQHREMLLKFNEIIPVLAQNKCQDAVQLADVMYNLINQKSVDEWEELIKKINSKSSLIL